MSQRVSLLTFLIAAAGVIAAAAIWLVTTSPNRASVPLLPDAACQPPLCAQLDLGFKQQETNLWCWAASGEMVMDPLLDVRQCDLANKLFKAKECCDTQPPDAKCINGGFPPFEHEAYGFKVKRTTDQALSWETLKDEITKGGPVAFSWHWKDRNGGHMMVAIGYREGEDETTHIVKVLDPQYATADVSLYTYKYYVESSGHTHWDDFYEIKR